MGRMRARLAHCTSHPSLIDGEIKRGIRCTEDIEDDTLEAFHILSGQEPCQKSPSVFLGGQGPDAPDLPDRGIGFIRISDKILCNFLVWATCQRRKSLLIALEGFVPTSCEQGGKN